MTDFPISGKKIPEIDLRSITVSEWRALFSSSQPEHEGDQTIAKASGMTVEEIRALPLYDFRALFKAVLEMSSKPLDNDIKN